MKLEKFDGEWLWVDKVCNVSREINVSDKQAYEWVKTGYWNFKEFSQWLKVGNKNEQENQRTC